MKSSVIEKDMTGGEGKCYHTILLPDMFYGDHKERDLPSGEIARYSGNRVLVECTLDELYEILNDAEYYASMTRDDLNSSGQEYREFYRPLILSARRTANRIKEYLKDLSGVERKG
ncbi:MAG: hypothetical protein WAZ30_14780 [Syntrophorhabdus sp.]